MGSTSGETGRGGKAPGKTEMLGPSWETRLEEARARRAAALAAKGGAEEPPFIEKPWDDEGLPETPTLIDETRENVARLKRERRAPASPSAAAAEPRRADKKPRPGRTDRAARVAAASAAAGADAVPATAERTPGTALAIAPHPLVRGLAAMPRWGLVAAGAVLALVPVAGYVILARPGMLDPAERLSSIPPLVADDPALAPPRDMGAGPGGAEAPAMPTLSAGLAEPARDLARTDEPFRMAASGADETLPRLPEAVNDRPLTVETLDFPVQLVMSRGSRQPLPDLPGAEGGRSRSALALPALRAPADDLAFAPGVAPDGAPLPVALSLPTAPAEAPEAAAAHGLAFASRPDDATAPRSAGALTVPEADGGPAVPEPPAATAGPTHPVLLSLAAAAPPAAVQPEAGPRLASLEPGPAIQGSGGRLDGPETVLGALPTLPGDPPPPAAVPAVPDALVVMHAPATLDAGDVAADAEAVAAETGLIPEIADPVSFKISETNVRYFHPDDREAAAAVAEALSARLRDFTGFEPAPDPGTIEVWLAGEGEAPVAAAAEPAPAPARRAPVRARPTPPRPVFETTTITRTRRSGLLSGQ